MTLPRLVRPRATDVDYWCREWLREANNALSAHMEVYASNPGGWDQHSSHGALQRVVDDLTRYTLALVAPVSPLEIPQRHKVLVKLLKDYLVLSAANPLVREGYGIGDTARYARLLTSVLTVYVLALQHSNPDVPYAAWRKVQKAA